MLLKLRLWLLKRHLQKVEGSAEFTRKWKDLRIKCVKDEDGMQIVVHRHKPGDNFWTYTRYEVHDDMSLSEEKSGKYPTSFVQ